MKYDGLTHMQMILKKIENIPLLVVWSAAVILLVIIFIFRNEYQSAKFIGIVEPGEIVVSRERAVVLKKLHVLPGQKADKDMLLVELESPDLNEKAMLVSVKLGQLLQQYRLNNNMRIISESVDKGAARPPVTGSFSLLDIQISTLSSELDFYNKEKEKLRVIADIPCVIGAVHFRAGETIQPYAPILTMIPERPVFIRGYIQENTIVNIRADDTIYTRSMVNSSSSAEGKVLSVGSKMIMLPERLILNPGIKLWGREIMIRIPPGNTLVFDEKVIISSRRLTFLDGIL